MRNLVRHDQHSMRIGSDGCGGGLSIKRVHPRQTPFGGSHIITFCAQENGNGRRCVWPTTHLILNLCAIQTAGLGNVFNKLLIYGNVYIWETCGQTRSFKVAPKTSHLLHARSIRVYIVRTANNAPNTPQASPRLYILCLTRAPSPFLCSCASKCNNNHPHPLVRRATTELLFMICCRTLLNI